MFSSFPQVSVHDCLKVSTAKQISVLAVDTFNNDTWGKRLGAEGINSQAPTDVQNMIISLDVGCYKVSPGSERHHKASGKIRI